MSKERLISSESSSKRGSRARRQLLLERLEQRTLLAYTFTGGGTSTGTATGDGNADTLYIDAFDGLVLHSTDGTVFHSDWGGGMTIAASSANTINIAQGAGPNAHNVILGGVLGPESALQVQVNIQNGAANDSVTVDDSSNSVPTTYTDESGSITSPSGVNVHFGAALGLGRTLLGGSGANTFDINSTTSGEPQTITGGGDDDTFTATGASSDVTLNGGAGNDSFDITPSANGAFTIDGNDPTPPASPGDTLTLNIPSDTTGIGFSDASDGTGHTGQYTFDNLQPVNYTTIETLTTVADLAITVTGPAQPVSEGGMLVYPVSITNGGTLDATDVGLSDVLPDNLSFSFGSFSQGDPVTAAGQTVSSNLGTIPAGATVTGTIVAQALEFGVVNNTVSVTTDAIELNTANNSDSATTTVVDALLSPINGTTISATKGKSFTGVVGGFTDGNPNSDLSDFSAMIDWGDGTNSWGTVVVGTPGFSVTGAHVYTSTGSNLPITITVKDIGGSTATIHSLASVLTSPPPPPPPSGTVSLITDPFNSSEKALDIVGTNNADTITVTKSGSSQGKAVVKINGVNKGTFSFSGSILIYGKDGDDNISIDSGITRSAWVWAGDGKDTVNGGGGNDFILGQDGNDSLNGNGGRDILIGGDGADKLNGGAGDDLLIAGDFKSTPSMSQLASVQKEWDRTDKSYTYRTSHLTSGGGYNTIKLNSSTLFSSTTLKDSLTGGSDSDLFFAAMSGDKVTDKASSETVVNIG